jgi:hypothetical protein
MRLDTDAQAISGVRSCKSSGVAEFERQVVCGQDRRKEELRGAGTMRSKTI